MVAVGPNRFVDKLVQLNLEHPKTTTQKLVIGNNRALGSVELEALRKAVQHHNIARLEFGGFGSARFGLEGFVDLDRGARVPRNGGGGGRVRFVRHLLGYHHLKRGVGGVPDPLRRSATTRLAL